jgi:hypothetical protein
MYFHKTEMNLCSLMVCALLICVIAQAAQAGIYSKPSNDPTNPYDAPVSKSDSSIVAWANTVIDYSPAPGVSSTYQNPETGYGSLGDLTQTQIDEGVLPGSITIGFEVGIADGAGHDFAVFENGFAYGSPNGLFAELAFVEVSSNGTDFARFEAISTNTAPVAGSGGFSGWDTTNMYNLAGKNQSGWGTPFDLAELASHALVTSGLLDLNNIQYVRLVDIPGTGHYLDSLGNPILDAHPTSGSGGYDFRLSEGVGVINEAPEPATMALLAVGGTGLLARRRRRTGRAIQ